MPCVKQIVAGYPEIVVLVAKVAPNPDSQSICVHLCHLWFQSSLVPLRNHYPELSQ